MEGLEILTALSQSLGWTVLHSLWQMSLLAAILYLVLAAIRPKHADLRYLLSYGTLVLGGLLFVTTFFYYFPWSALDTSQVAGESSSISFVFSPTEYQAVDISWLSQLEYGLENSSAWIGLLWFMGLLVLSFRYVLAYQMAHQLRSRGLAKVPVEWQERFQDLVRESAVNWRTSIWFSSRISSPITIGHFKPIVLVPLGFFNQLSPAQVEAILWHELAHIRRHDYLFNGIQILIKTLLFYHPAIAWISRQIDQEREHACDDFALTKTANPRVFAQALGLLQLQMFNTPNPIAMHATQGNNSTLGRLKRIFNQNEPIRQKWSLRILLPLVLITLSGVLLAFQGQANIAPDENEYVEQKIMAIDSIPIQGDPQAREEALRLREEALRLKEEALQQREMAIKEREMAQKAYDEARRLNEEMKRLEKERAEKLYKEYGKDKEKQIKELKEREKELRLYQEKAREQQRAHNEREREAHLKESREQIAELRAAQERERAARMEYQRQLHDERRAYHEEVRAKHDAMVYQLREVLIEDGLINDNADSFQIEETDGKVTVNGKVLDDEKAEKYRKIMKKFGRKPSGDGHTQSIQVGPNGSNINIRGKSRSSDRQH